MTDMTDTDASKLTSLCTALAVVGVLLGLAFNSGGPAATGASTAAVVPAAVAAAQLPN